MTEVVAINLGLPSAIPPYSLPQGTLNFAIEVGITIPQGMSFGQISITSCGSTTSNGWEGYKGVIAGPQTYVSPLVQIYAGQDRIAETDFAPNSQLYIYRLEVRGNVISLFAKGGLVAQATDNKFLRCGSQIGIMSSRAVIHISSFKVILL